VACRGAHSRVRGAGVSAAPRRRPKDRDFVETAEGFFFCLVGYLHPPDRYTAYLKYTPAESGRWTRGDVCYRREVPYYHVQNVMRTLEFLEREHPRYVWVDRVQGLRFSFVPRDAVRRYYLPEARLAGILGGPADALEQDVAALVTLLISAAGIPVRSFGITGSVLLGIHDPTFSDIDLLVYGGQPAARVKRAIMRLAGDGLRELDPGRRDRWRAETAERFGLAPDELTYLDGRRWHYFRFRDRYVSVHATRADREIREAHGERRYRPLGPATVEATIADASESLFLPAVYKLAEAHADDGTPIPVSEIVSYEGLFCDFADAGDRVRARGALEEVSDGSLRLVVGTAALADGGALSRVTSPPSRC